MQALINTSQNPFQTLAFRPFAAGVGRSFGDLLREQLKANPANFIIIKEAFKIIETLERGEHADTTDMNIALRPLFAAPVQDFMISLMQSDPAQMAKKANKKTLIIQGRHDLQVSVKDAEILADATGGRLVKSVYPTNCIPIQSAISAGFSSPSISTVTS